MKGLLEGENIEVEVRGESLYGVRREVPITPDTFPSMWVMDDAGYDRAMELVSRFRQEKPPNLVKSDVWRCSYGEENESQFTECWSCGKARSS